MMEYNDIGSLVVHCGRPDNPWFGSICGHERSEALGRFLRIGERGEYTFWLLTQQPPREITTPEEANIDPAVIDYYWTDGTSPTSGGTSLTSWRRKAR